MIKEAEEIVVKLSDTKSLNNTQELGTKSAGCNLNFQVQGTNK